MFDMELKWDRPARTGKDASVHVLRVRLKPRAGNVKLPLRVAIALDTSGSMEGEKLNSAKKACLSVLKMMRPEDKVWFASFSTNVVPLCNAINGDIAEDVCSKPLNSIKADGITRTDLALSWVHESLPRENNTARVGILITDGHATNLQGEPLTELGFIVDSSREISTDGISLCSVGLGNANDFNTSFLNDLANSGKGEFIFADTDQALESRLQSRFLASQSIGLTDATVQFNISRTGCKVKNLCRFKPDYIPMDTPLSKNPFDVNIGDIRSDTETDLLFEIEVPPLNFGEGDGDYKILDVELKSSHLSNSLNGSVDILYTSSFSKAQALNDDVDQDRICRDTAIYTEQLNKTTDPQKTGELLNKIIVNADDSGQDEIKKMAQSQLDTLQKSGKLDINISTSLLDKAKKTGGK